MDKLKRVRQILPEADINGKYRNYVNERVLNDERIRRVILSNLNEIKEYERLRGSKQVNALNEYINNKYSVWNTYNKNHKTKRYISAGQILLYLAYLGYSLEYNLVKVC